MREVHVSGQVLDKISEIEYYLQTEMKLTKEAALKRSDRMRVFVKSLSAPIDYAPCKYKRWVALGYRCAVFEKTWIFVYEIVDGGVIVRDMAHTATLFE